MNDNAKNAAGFEQRITEAVKQFALNDQAFTDLAMLRIDPESLEIEVVDEPDPDEMENDSTHDYVALMDLVEVDPADPALWIPDTEAIASLAADYL